jgi:hypothetical protein
MVERIENLKAQIKSAFVEIKTLKRSPKDTGIGKMINELRELDEDSYKPILEEYKNDVYSVWNTHNPAPIKKRKEIIILEDIGADGKTNRLRISGIDDKPRIKKPAGQPRIRAVKPTGKKDGSCFEFNGQYHGKGRAVHAVLKNMVLKNPDITLAELEAPFEGVAKNKYGVCKELSVAKELSTKFKRFFLREDDLIKLKDGTKVAVSKEWGSTNMPGFVTKAKELGFNLKDA